MRPGAPITTLVGPLGSGKSTLLTDVPPDSDALSSGTIQMVALVGNNPIALRDLETFLDLVKRVAGPKLLGLSGLVALSDDPKRPLVLDALGLTTYPLQRRATWPSGDRRTRMIAITHDLDPAILKRLFVSVTDPWRDRTRIRVAMAAVAALVVVFVGLALALHSNARTAAETASTALLTPNQRNLK
jgi:G3E family GTPase